MTKLGSLLALAVLASSTACAPRQDDNTVMASLSQANSQYIELVAKGDIERLMATYDDDAVLLPPAAAPIQGPDAIRAYWSDFFAAWVVVEAKSVVDEVIAADGWAYARGHYAMTIRSKDGKTTMSELGKFSGISRHHGGGTWRIARDMWNVDPVAGSGS